ncbi:hypothetical protein DLJ57_16890, partial [Micromonospora chalcea]
MADLNVPPRRPRDDRGWDGYQHPHPDGYRDPHAAPYAGAHPGAAPGPQWVGPDGFAPAAGGYP